MAAVAPDARLALVPAAGFPRSELDARLRELLLDVLRDAAWLPGAAGADVAPRTATVLDLPAPELPALLADVLPGLLAPIAARPLRQEGAGPRDPLALLAELDVHRMGPAELADRLLGVRRPADWWRAVYAALEPAVDTVPGLRDELRALPVPLADGRTVPGPAGVLLPLGADAGVGDLALPGLHVVDPDAVHPLLLRLGAALAEPDGLLDHRALRDAVDRSVDDADAGLDPVPLAEAVLGLVAELGPGAAASREWLAALALTDVDGEPARADELMLPDAALRPLLSDDAPPAVLAPEWQERASRQVLVAVGVLDGFAVVETDAAHAADLGLDDVDRWLSETGSDDGIDTVVAVRDLDLVRDDAWPAALALLAGQPETRAAVLAPALVHGVVAGPARPPARSSAGLLAPAVGDRAGRALRPATRRPAADDAVLAAAGVRAALAVADRRDAADLLARLADPDRRPDAALVADAHAALAAAVVDGRVDPGDLDPPDRVRALDGSVADVADAVVLDTPELVAVLPAGEVVVGGDPKALADLLDLPTASEIVDGEVADAGRPVPWGCAARGRRDLPCARRPRARRRAVVPRRAVGRAAPAGAGPAPRADLAGRRRAPPRRRPRPRTARRAPHRLNRGLPTVRTIPATSPGLVCPEWLDVVPRVVIPAQPRDGAGRVRRVCLLSVHTSPLAQPGTGDAGGMNVYVVQTALRMARRGIEVEIFTRATSSEHPPVVRAGAGRAGAPRRRRARSRGWARTTCPASCARSPRACCARRPGTSPATTTSCTRTTGSPGRSAGWPATAGACRSCTPRTPWPGSRTPRWPTATRRSRWCG